MLLAISFRYLHKAFSKGRCYSREIDSFRVFITNEYLNKLTPQSKYISKLDSLRKNGTPAYIAELLGQNYGSGKFTRQSFIRQSFIQQSFIQQNFRTGKVIRINYSDRQEVLL